MALAPNLAELVYAAGAGSRLIAVSRFSDFPEDAKKLPVVSDAFAINLEALAALRPVAVAHATDEEMAAMVASGMVQPIERAPVCKHGTKSDALCFACEAEKLPPGVLAPVS